MTLHVPQPRSDIGLELGVMVICAKGVNRLTWYVLPVWIQSLPDVVLTVRGYSSRVVRRILTLGHNGATLQEAFRGVNACRSQGPILVRCIVSGCQISGCSNGRDESLVSGQGG